MATTKKRTSKSSRGRNQAKRQQEARNRGLVWGGVALGALTVAIGAGVALLARRDSAGSRDTGGEHPVPDLAADAPDPGRSDARAPVDFRPDPTAVPDKSEYDSLRPATGASPTLSGTRGDVANQTGIGG